MNVIIDIRCLVQAHRTGVGEYTTQLLSALFELDHKNQYFLFYNSYKDVSDIIPQWKQDNVQYVVSRWPSKLFNALIWLKIITLDTFIKKRIQRLADKGQQQIDIRDFDYFFAPNINFIHLSKQIKFVLTIHDLSFEFFKECYSWKRRLWHRLIRPHILCRQAYRVVTPSDHTRHDVMLEYGIHGDQVVRIYPGLSSMFFDPRVHPPHIQKKYHIPQEYILYLGTIEPRKNLHTLLDAYQQLHPSRRKLPLVIVGGRGWQYRDVLRRVDHMEDVYYVGYVADIDRVALYDYARIFVFPSLYEGFGFPVLEAMSRGIPVITTFRSSLPEVVGAGGYLVSSHNTTQLADAMHQILNHQTNYDIIGEIAQKRSELFRWDRTAKEFLALLTT